METKIRTKKDAEEWMNNEFRDSGDFGEPTASFSTGGSYWKHGYGNRMSLKKIDENTYITSERINNAWQRNVNMTKEEIVSYVYKNRKYINFFMDDDE